LPARLLGREEAYNRRRPNQRDGHVCRHLQPVFG
jgi:hypothetical protein